MEIAFMFALSALFWTHSWQMLNVYTNPRALGIVAAAVAVLLLGLVFFGQGLIMIPEISGPFTAYVLVWIGYAAVVAALSLWGYDDRTLGFYSLFVAVISLLYVVYFFLGDGLLLDAGTTSATGLGAQETGPISWILGIVSVTFTLLMTLMFFYLAPPFMRMRTVTGWFYLVLSVVVLVLAGLVVLGLPLASF